MPKKNFLKRIFSAGIAMVMACSMMAVPAFAAVDEINIDVRVLDQSTGRIIEDVAMLTAYADPNSGYVQSDDFQVPSLSTLTDVDFGRVEKVMGNYYFPVGQVSEGSMIEWSTNNRNGTLTYYVTSWNPDATSGSGSNGSDSNVENIGSGSRYNWSFKLTYHSNYPDGTDYTQSFNYKASSFTQGVQVPVKSLDDLGFSVPEGYQQAAGPDNAPWNRNKDGSGEWVKTTWYAHQSDGADLHLYAQWSPENSKPAPETVTLTHKDGEEVYAERDYFVGDTATTVMCSNDHAPSTFAGWDTDISADQVIYPAGDSFVISEDETVYAVWEEAAEPTDTIDLNYDANGGSGAPANETSDTSVGSNAEFTVSDTIPTHPDDLPFLGWADDPDAEEPDYQPGDSITTTSDKTIYAVWGTKEDEGGPDADGKISEPGMDKKAEGQDSIPSVAPGDTINFTLDSHIGSDLADSVSYQDGTYSGSYTLTFHDTLTGPATLDTGSISVKIGTTTLNSGEYSVDTAPDDGHTFDLTIDVVALLNSGRFQLSDAGLPDKAAVQVAYTATVDESAEDQDQVRNDAYVNDSATDSVNGGVVDMPEPPDTGSRMALAFTACGVALMGGVAVVYITKTRKKAD